MIWIFKAIGFFGTGLGKLSAIVAALTTLVVLRQIDKTNLRNQGAKIAVEKIEKANDKATDLGKKAAAKSRAAPAAGRVRSADRDPTTRDD